MPASIDATSKGWMPGAKPIAVPASNYAIGMRDRKAAVLHMTAGSAKSARERFQNPTQQVSAHFLVLKTGEIWQFVSVLDTAYANGLKWIASPKCWQDPEGNLLKPPHAPAWAGLTPPINPNWQTISIERELLSTSDIPPDAQNDAVVRILRYVHELFPTLIPSWIPFQTLIGHCHISPIERANCPGPLCNYDVLAKLANVTTPLPVVQHYCARGLPVYQQQNLTGPTAGFLATGDVVDVDVLYSNGAGHLKSGLGFVDMKGLEVAP